jgi:membrane-associated phospholipid phosphatase
MMSSAASSHTCVDVVDIEDSPRVAPERVSTTTCKPLSQTVSHNWHKYAIGDWLIGVVLYAVLGGLQLVSAHHRYIPNPNDAAINYPMLTETVPTSLLMVLAVLMPAVLMIMIFFLKRKNSPIALRELSSVLSGLILATAIAAVATDIVKKAVGRPRPNFIQLCDWDFALKECSPTIPLSTSNNAYASFPSGHSSFSFAGLTFLSLYLLTLVPHLRNQRLRPAASSAVAASESLQSASESPSVLPQQQPSVGARMALAAAAGGSKEAWVWLLCVLPVFLAGWISMTRIIDYWHWFDDVLTGCLLGFAVAHFVASFKLPPLQLALANEYAVMQKDSSSPPPQFDNHWYIYFGHEPAPVIAAATPPIGAADSRVTTPETLPVSVGLMPSRAASR